MSETRGLGIRCELEKSGLPTLEEYEAARQTLASKTGEWDVKADYTDEEWAALKLLRNRNPMDFPYVNPGDDPHTCVIVGKSGGNWLTPWGAEGHEIWGLNDYTWLKGWPMIGAHSRWFQLHPPHYLRKHYPEGIADLSENWSVEDGIGVRLYMDRHYPEYPDSEPYPKADVEALTPRGDYHTSSMDWMLGLAILEGFPRILVCGVNLITFPIMNGEPISSRACMEYWVGVADGRGIDLQYLGPPGHMFQNLHMATYQSRLQYGFEHEPALDLEKETKGAWRDTR